MEVFDKNGNIIDLIKRDDYVLKTYKVEGITFDANKATKIGTLASLGATESENALLRADKYTDQKIVEVYKDLQGQIKEVRGVVDVTITKDDVDKLYKYILGGDNLCKNFLICLKKK